MLFANALRLRRRAPRRRETGFDVPVKHLASPALSAGGVLTDQWGSIARENAVVDVDQGAFFGTHGDATEALPAGVDTCGLRGPIGGPCGCDYASVNRLNRDHVHPIVSSLVRTPFFRYFKVDLHCDCPLWPDDSMW